MEDYFNLFIITYFFRECFFFLKNNYLYQIFFMYIEYQIYLFDKGLSGIFSMILILTMFYCLNIQFGKKIKKYIFQ